MAWPGNAWHDIWHGLVGMAGMAWYTVWYCGYGMVNGKAW